MADLPEPLTPPDCDLRGLLFMPLDAQRLRDSDLALFSTGDEFKAAVLLWCASWHRIPAGSLPDDDRALCRFSGLDPKAWRKARDGALRGWIKCSDGLLYHEVVAEKARETWEDRQRYRQKREADRERLKDWRDRKHNTAETGGGNAPETRTETPDETRFETPKGVECKRSGGDIDANASVSPASSKSRNSYPEDFERAWAAYPHHPGRSSKPNALAEWRKLPPQERTDLPDRVARFAPNVEAVCGGKGAPDMARWLKQGKHLNWTEAEPAAATPEADPWPRRLLQWDRAGYWNSDWGAKPGKPGYLGPAHEPQRDPTPQPDRSAA